VCLLVQAAAVVSLAGPVHAEDAEIMETADATLETEFQDSLLDAPTPIPGNGFHLDVDTASLDGYVDAVHAAIGDGATSFAEMMDNANRDRRALCPAGGAYDTLTDITTDIEGFCFNSGDSRALYWYPQGITTTHDATASGLYQGHQAVVNSWYHKPEYDPDNSGSQETWVNKGVRLSFTDWDANYPNKYRNVLLVEPVAGGDFTSVVIHAGGIMWYGNLLYVADVTRGMRVFDLRRIYRVSAADSTRVGRQPDGSYQAFGYSYVMVQVGWVRNVGDDLRYSFLSLDRSTRPDSVVVGEYVALREDAPRGRVVRFSLDGRTSLPALGADGLGHGVEAYSAYHRMNGVLAHGNRYWFATIHRGGVADEDGNPGYGRLVFWDRGTPATTPLPWAIGPEDLTYWADADSGDRIWTLTEYPGKRAVLSVPHTDLVAQAPVVAATVEDAQPTAVPETATPGTVTPETVTPGTATPGTATPETATPETATPETVTPGTDR
jgi:hypothetical protein